MATRAISKSVTRARVALAVRPGSLSQVHPFLNGASSLKAASSRMGSMFGTSRATNSRAYTASGPGATINNTGGGASGVRSVGLASGPIGSSAVAVGAERAANTSGEQASPTTSILSNAYPDGQPPDLEAGKLPMGEQRLSQGTAAGSLDASDDDFDEDDPVSGDCFAQSPRPSLDLNLHSFALACRRIGQSYALPDSNTQIARHALLCHAQMYAEGVSGRRGRAGSGGGMSEMETTLSLDSRADVFDWRAPTTQIFSSLFCLLTCTVSC